MKVVIEEDSVVASNVNCVTVKHHIAIIEQFSLYSVIITTKRIGDGTMKQKVKIYGTTSDYDEAEEWFHNKLNDIKHEIEANHNIMREIGDNHND